LGWQQRDWAKLDDAELEQLYGVQPRVAAHSGAFWAVIVSLLLTVLGIGWTFREHAAKVPVQNLTPGLLYGMVIPEGSSLGPAGVCQELERLADNTWRCDSIDLNMQHAAVIPAKPYEGPCAHLLVVASRWVCLAAG
jgi:hypothetical protein